MDNNTIEPKFNTPLRVVLIVGLGLIWWSAHLSAGVSRDAYRIPFEQKIALTFGSVLVLIIVFWLGGKLGKGCGCIMALYFGMSIIIMWTWNS